MQVLLLHRSNFIFIMAKMQKKNPPNIQIILEYISLKYFTKTKKCSLLPIQDPKDNHNLQLHVNSSKELIYAYKCLKRFLKSTYQQEVGS